MRKINSIARTLFAVCLMLGVTSTPGYAQKTPPLKGTATTGASAKFRITLNGFAVNNQSDDDILEGDGKGDEIYLRADFWEMNKNGVATKHTQRSATLGDVNNQPNRKQAGSASSKGGLRTNDKYPTDQPWARGALQTLELPMLLWMGTLTQGEDGVLIIPTVWEWDSPDASKSETEWDNSLDRLFNLKKPEMLNRIQNKVLTTALAPQVWDMNNSAAGTRPIGSDIYRNLGLTGVTISVQTFALTYDSAMEAARTSPNNSGPGVFAFRYTDAQDHGDYTIYIQVEKLN
jgi:hypothetical protein